MAKSKGSGQKAGRSSRPSYPANKPSTTGKESGGQRSNNTSQKSGKANQ